MAWQDLVQRSELPQTVFNFIAQRLPIPVNPPPPPHLSESGVLYMQCEGVGGIGVGRGCARTGIGNRCNMLLN